MSERFEIVDGDPGVRVVKRDGEPVASARVENGKIRLTVHGTHTIQTTATVSEGESISLRDAVANGLVPEGFGE